MGWRVAPRLPSYVRELRHDFRAYYHVAYDDVPADEAVDLALSLPDGSLYMGALDPRRAWPEGQRTMADVLDAVWKFINMESDARTTEGAPRMPRPWDAWVRQDARRKAASVRRRIEDAGWEDVDV